MFRAPGSEFWFKKKSIAEASVRNLERGTRTGTMNPNRNENPNPELGTVGPQIINPHLDLRRIYATIVCHAPRDADGHGSRSRAPDRARSVDGWSRRPARPTGCVGYGGAPPARP